VPACTHPFFTPLRSISGAFSGKVLLPDLALLHQKFGDGRGVFDNAVFIAVSSLPLLSLSGALAFVIPGPGGCDCGILGKGFDEAGRKNYVEGAVHNHFEDFVKTYETIVDHRAVLVFFAFTEPTLDANLHSVYNLGGEFAVGANATLENDFLGQNHGGEQFDAIGEGAAGAE